MEPNKTSLTAIFALIFSFLCFPLGIILGIVAILKINKSDGQLGGKGLAIAAIVISAAVMVPGIGCGAAIAIPNFVKFQCRAKQSEAKSKLKMLYVAQESYRMETDAFTSDVSKLNLRSSDRKERYNIRIISSDKASFTAEAVGIGEMTGDLWRVDENNRVQNVNNGC